MIGEKDKNTILDLSKKYNISKVVLFGSSLVEQGGGRDIDIAIDGLSDCHFFSWIKDWRRISLYLNGQNIIQQKMINHKF